MCPPGFTCDMHNLFLLTAFGIHPFNIALTYDKCIYVSISLGPVSRRVDSIVAGQLVIKSS
jgi:hypothetical protein